MSLTGPDGLVVLRKIGMHEISGTTVADAWSMDIQYQPHDSAMQRFIHPSDAIRIYLSRADHTPIELTGGDLIRILTLHFCQADATIALAQRIAELPRRRLLHQHKALRGL